MKHNFITTMSAFAVGATAMYYLDPEQGRRRRALVRDKVISASAHTADASRAQARRVANRAQGWTSRLTARFSSIGKARTPGQLHDRIRSHVGRLVSHPKAVDVEVIGDGRVRLTGHILEDELEVLLTGVESVPGVTHVANELMVHESAGAIPELQGGSRGPGERRAGRDRLWRALAVMAPVAILAAAVRPAPRHQSVIGRLSANRRASPLLALKRRRYLSALRAS